MDAVVGSADRNDRCNARIVVIGAHSFLGETLRDSGLYSDLVLINRHAPDLRDVLRAADVVINFSFDPAFRHQPMAADADLDALLAQMIKGGRGIFVMASSRMVYGRNHDWPGIEAAAIGITNRYGETKRQAEAAIRTLLPGQHLILRLSNVIGFERRHGRQSFMTRMLTNLRNDGRIVFDHDPGHRKDFLPAGDFARAMARFLKRGATGTYNLGAGFALPCRAIAEAVIAGYGSGTVVWQPSAEAGSTEFYLSMARARDVIGDISDPGGTLAYCRQLGERLQHG